MELFEAVARMEPSEVIGLALAACEVRAYTESEKAGAWKSIVIALNVLKHRAYDLEGVPWGF